MTFLFMTGLCLSFEFTCDSELSVSVGGFTSGVEEGGSSAGAQMTRPQIASRTQIFNI